MTNYHQIIFLLSFFLFIQQWFLHLSAADNGFVRVNGVQFMLNGQPFYANGLNTYWLMDMASNPSQRFKVTAAFQEAVGSSLVICRTWAFSDGGPNALQSSPGVYNENVFQGLDFVLSEARRFGVKLILCLVNNWEGYGGKAQYVQWARQRGENIPNDDGFFTNPLVKSFYKNHIKTVLTRVNTITKIAYKDDPTIMAWELMNEPRCASDLSGTTVLAWVGEMVPYLKSIDNKHLLEVGTEGFYGPYSLERNPNNALLGGNFIYENQIHGVDFAAFHAYSYPWLFNGVTPNHPPNNALELEFMKRWVNDHIQHAQEILHKPILLAELGKSSKDQGYVVTQRDALFNVSYSEICASAAKGGAGAGVLFWQQFVEGMNSYSDGFEIILSERSTTVKLIAEQAKKMRLIR